MQFSGVAASVSRPATSRAVRGVATIIVLTCMLFMSVAWTGATVRGATSGPSTAVPAASTAAAVPLKMVVIVGPAGSQTDADLTDAEALAVLGESYGMDVRRVFFPHATWDNVMANIQGANLVVYMGHGYGWPSPYTNTITESRQDGVGLNSWDGSGKAQYTYYGANVIKEYWTLAPNAIVFLNHDCYTSGNGEPTMAIPSWDVAVQRVDNFANGFLAVGAGAVFAFEWQRFNKTLNLLMTTDETMAQIFETPGKKPTGMWGWVGWDARKFDSVRTPGARNYLDPDPNSGFLRAVTGNLQMTASEWAAGGGGDPGEPPVLSHFKAQGTQYTVATGNSLPVFTPNGDGVTDLLDMTYTVDREAFVDLTVSNAGGNVIRTMSSWSPGGDGSATWDGKRDDGNYVSDGTFTITATPRDRAGDIGDPQSLQVMVLTTMSYPGASPQLFYPGDGDSLAATTTLSVTLNEEATFWWKIADADGNVVRTFVNGVDTAPGAQTAQWDGRDKNGAFVADGTYYSVTTTATADGTYFHSVAVEIRAFDLTANKDAPFVRGTKVKVYVTSAEPLLKNPHVKLYFDGLAVKSYGTYKLADGTYWVKVAIPATVSPGTAVFRAIGKDINGQKQWTDYTFDIQ
jgi:flagellar hook assembly protein FlgD